MAVADLDVGLLRSRGGGAILHDFTKVHPNMFPPNERSLTIGTTNNWLLKSSCGLLLALPHSVRYYYDYTLLHAMFINYCGTGCIRRLMNYS